MLAKIEQLLQEVKGLTAQNPEELEALRKTEFFSLNPYLCKQNN